MVRNVLAFLAGLIVALIVANVIQLINYFFIVPTPLGYEPGSPAFQREFVRLTPALGFFVVCLSHLLGAFAGGALIARLANDETKVFPVGLGLFLILLWIGMIVVIPHPLWIAIVVTLIFIPAALFGFQTAVSLKGRSG